MSLAWGVRAFVTPFPLQKLRVEENRVFYVLLYSFKLEVFHNGMEGEPDTWLYMSWEADGIVRHENNVLHEKLQCGGL